MLTTRFTSKLPPPFVVFENSMKTNNEVKEFRLVKLAIFLVNHVVHFVAFHLEADVDSFHVSRHLEVT